MNQQPTAETVVTMLREEGIAEVAADFPQDGDLFEAGMDSMAVMHLIVAVEQRFGAVIGPADTGRDNLASPAALARLIGRSMPS